MVKNMINRECFAYHNDNVCRILSEMICKNRNCSFYKTKKKFKVDLEKYPNISFQKSQKTIKKSEVL